MNVDLMSLGVLYVLGVFLLIYLFSILPAKRKNSKIRAMHDAVKPGDEIVTIGGIIGEVLSRSGEEVELRLNSSGTTMRILIYAVQSIRAVDRKSVVRERV